ncbi:MAG: pitrilysin family protein [Planctomycetota bacterium]
MAQRIESWAILGLCLVAFLCSGVPTFNMDDATAQEPEKPTIEEVRSIEGITEYSLPNGTQVLLIPDASKSIVTVNMTVFVGSRHEGYGEAGMAHLLEHMLFKGTPGHEKIPETLKNKGADFNGTTWLDRTNYYETLPAATPEQGDENLEFAIRMEADRLVNSYVRGEDLASEMTVVRNEFERGENSPQRILMQRVQSTAYDWHNYGRSTIGNRSDIERVPVDRLKAFYRKFYRPDNIMVVVAGKFETDKALEYLEKYFGILEAPEEPLDRTYTTEPAQDGERTVVLRRVGNTQLVMGAYHVPSGASRQFAAVEMLAYMFGAEPSGRLYKSLVEPEIASNSYAMSMALHDPGLMMFGAQVPVGKSIESARQELIQVIESVGDEPITDAELKRAKTQFAKDRELRSTDSQGLAIELSEWAAQGDWRLYFLFRDYIEQVTKDECTEAAKQFLTRNNRTVGLYIPSEESERIEMPSKPNLEELLAGYEGRGEIAAGEEFDPSPANVEQRTTRGELKNGMKTAWLPKKTRGGKVNLNISLRYGNEKSLQPLKSAADFLPRLMMRGTENLSYTELQDRLDELRAQVNLGGSYGLLSASVETKREYLPEVLPLIGEILRQPLLSADELALLQRQAVVSAESSMTDPSALASISLRRALAPYEKDNIRYVATLEERLENIRSVTADQVKELHAQIGAKGEVTAVGDFDTTELESLCNEIFAAWKSDIDFSRIPTPAAKVPGGVKEIETPDKENAVYYAGAQIPMRDDDPDYPALVIGNYIFGGGALSSRLGDRVRQKEGLSYGVGSGVSAHPIDERTNLTLYAITNPVNKDRVIEVIREELDLLLEKGVSEEELDAAKQGILQGSQLERTQDSNLANILGSTLFAKRDMSYYASMEKTIAELKVGAVNRALRKYIDPEKIVIFVAGDFAGAEDSKPLGSK